MDYFNGARSGTHTPAMTIPSGATTRAKLHMDAPDMGISEVKTGRLKAGGMRAVESIVNSAFYYMC